MNKNLSVDFAFEGFRLIRAKPMVLAIWGVVLLIINGGFLVGFYYAARPFIAQLQQIFAGAGTTDPKVVLGFVGAIVPFYILILLGALIIGAVFNCAVFRAVLDDSNKMGFGYLRLGGDELRQVGASLLFFLLFVVVEIAVVAVFIAVVAGLTAAKAKGLGVFLAVVLGIALFLAVIWIVVRLSLAMVQTFDQRRINLFGSWKLTQGHFWTLFGGYLVALLVGGIITAIAAQVIQLGVGLATGNMMPGGFMPIMPGQKPDLNAIMAAFTTPAFLVSLGLRELIVAPLSLAMSIAPVAAAYRTLRGETGASLAKLF